MARQLRFRKPTPQQVELPSGVYVDATYPGNERIISKAPESFSGHNFPKAEKIVLVVV